MGERSAEKVPLEKLTRFYLLNHFLRQKVDKHDIADVVGGVCGLHAQAPSTPYLSLWNRVKGFRFEMLDDALYKEKRLVKTWFTRGTLHIVPSKDLPVYHKALKTMWFGTGGKYLREVEWPSFEVRRKLVHPKILRALAEKPLRRKELSSRVCSLLGDKSMPCERLFSAWGGVLKETCYLGLTVCAEPFGNETCFARLDQWLPDVNLSEFGENQAKEKLLLKYLHSYGPASAQDFACWSGLLTSETNRMIENNEERLEEVRTSESGKRLWMLKEDFNALYSTVLEESGRVCLLPKSDSYLLGHRDRARIIEAEFLKQV